MDVDPWRAANDAARVTQNVTATTLINNKKPGFQAEKGEELVGYQLYNAMLNFSKVARNFIITISMHACKSLSGLLFEAFLPFLRNRPN